MKSRLLTEALYCTSMRFASSRCVRETGLKNPSQQGTGVKYLYAHLRTYTQPTQPLAAGASMQPTPSPLCELV